MNTPRPPHPRLDADELELARVVRALPGGGPPPALDAHILKAAQDAVASAPTRRRHAWAVLGSAWGASSAAAAVLALGVGWQLLHTPRNMLPASDSAPAPVVAEAEKQHSTEVDFIRREPPPMAMPPNEAPPPAVAVMPRQVAQPSRRDESTAIPVAEGAPEPFMDEHVTHATAAAAVPAPSAMAAAEAVEAGALAADHDRREQAMRSESFASGALAKASAPAAPPPPPPAPAVANVASAQGNDSVGLLAGSAVADVQPAKATTEMRARDNGTTTAAERQRVAADARLSRDDWLKRIRQRMRDNDTASARASLALYLDKFPGSRATLPTDLQRLLEP